MSLKLYQGEILGLNESDSRGRGIPDRVASSAYSARWDTTAAFHLMAVKRARCYPEKRVALPVFLPFSSFTEWK